MIQFETHDRRSFTALALFFVLAGCTEPLPAVIDVPPADPATLASPTGLTATPIWQDHVVVAWSAGDEEVLGYEVRRRLQDGDDWATIASPDGASTELHDAVSPGIPYEYQVTAVYEAGHSAAITSPAVTALSSTPTGVAAVALGGDTVSITWQDAAYENEVHVERAPTGGSFVSLGALPADTESYLDLSVVSGDSYTYRIVARRGDFEAASESVDLGLPPVAPAGFTAAAVRADTIRLRWDAPSRMGIGHHVYRRVSGDSAYALIASIAAGETQHDDVVAPLTSYDYRLVAWTAHGESGAVEVTDIATVANHAVALTVTGIPDVVFAHQPFSFSVTASNADAGDRVSVRWLNPMRGCTPTVFPDGLGEVSARVTCRLTERGRRYLKFTAFDDYAPAAVTQVTVTLNSAGDGKNSGTWTGDVTGDGIDDLVTLSRALSVDLAAPPMLHVWAGGAVTATPTATLVMLQPKSDHVWRSESVVIADVTGDGVFDIVAAESSQISVWAGGASLTGSPERHATLNGGVPLVWVGRGDQHAQAFSVGDVTGDGTEDVVAAAAITLGDPADVYVWEGGYALAGTQAATATLDVTAALGVFLADMNRDGRRDVVVRSADAIAIWNGGTLAGLPSPDATLTVAAREVILADLTGDGVRDVIAHAPTAAPTGAVVVWSGSNLTGTPAPTATLADPNAAANLGSTAQLSNLNLADVTGDDILDLIIASPNEDDGSEIDAGVVYVFAGGATIAGTVAPTAELRRQIYPNAYGTSTYAQGVKLGEVARANMYLSVPAVFFGDVVGDGYNDIVIAAPHASNFVTEPNGPSGAILVWKGGPSLTGEPAPAADLTAYFTRYLAGYTGIVLADVTGDGRKDIVAAAESQVAEFISRRIFVWAGGATLATVPKAELANGAVALLVGDWNGDGIDDVSAGDRIWNGGPFLQGEPSPAVTWGGSYLSRPYYFAHLVGDAQPDLVFADPADNVNRGRFGIVDGATYALAATLAVVGALANDKLGDVSPGGGAGLLLGDYRGDGRSHIIGVAPYADVDTYLDAGAAYFWDTSTALSGTVGPAARLAAPVGDDQTLGFGPNSP